jgi:hypothetical protein
MIPRRDPCPTVAELLAASEQASGYDALACQLMAGLEALQQQGIAITRLGPLVLLLKWLEDREQGTDDPLLPLPPRAASRPPTPGRVLEFNATCVWAFEILRAMGAPVAAAAARVGRDAPLPGNPAKTLRGWRDAFRASGKGRAPRDGEHWAVLEEGRAEIARLKREAPHQLRALYEGAIRHARALTDHCGLTGGVNPQWSVPGSSA